MLPYFFPEKITTFLLISTKGNDFLDIVTTFTLSAVQVIVSPVPFVKFNHNKF